MTMRNGKVRKTVGLMVNLLCWQSFMRAGIVPNIGTDVQSGVPSVRDVYADSMSRPRKRVVFSESDWRP